VTERRLVTARELAEQLGISTGALLRWTRAGQVPAVKLPGGAVRYRPEAIDAWVADRSFPRLHGQFDKCPCIEKTASVIDGPTRAKGRE
jgi:excisionase family DNA binding protein